MASRARDKAREISVTYDRPLAAVALTAVLLLVLLTARMVNVGGPSGAPVAGGLLFVHEGHPKDLKVNEHSTGYDGQFVYRLALDPFSREETQYGITFDNPPYRQQRIALPVVAWAVHTTTRIPMSVTLLLVNALALLAAAWAAAVLARRMGRNALWGAAVALAPGLVVAICRDLTEPVAAAFLLLGLVAWTGRRTPLALAAFTVSALARETSLAVLFGLGVYEMYVAIRGPDRIRAAARAAGLIAVPLGVVAAWQVHLRDVWGTLPIRATQGDVGTPVAHTLQKLFANGGAWSDWHTKDALLMHVWVAERLVLLAVVVATAYALLGKADSRIKAGWVLGALLALTATWDRDVAFLRASNEAVVMGILVLLGSRTRAANAALTATCGLSLLAALMNGVIL